MRKMIIALILGGVMLSAITYVYAQGPGFGPGHWRMYSHEQWGPGRGSPLTPEQRAKFQELRRKFIEETAQLRGAILTKRLELRSLWTDPKADPKAIMGKEKEMRDLQNQIRDKAVQLKLEGRKILTPEQLTQLGSGWRIGPDSGRGYMRGYGHRMGYGYGLCD
jgi:Spy/CpxP family protein refolding chaperone